MNVHVYGGRVTNLARRVRIRFKPKRQLKSFSIEKFRTRNLPDEIPHVIYLHTCFTWVSQMFFGIGIATCMHSTSLHVWFYFQINFLRTHLPQAIILSEPLQPARSSHRRCRPSILRSRVRSRSVLV